MKSKPSCLLIVLVWFANLHSVLAQNPAFELSSSPAIEGAPQWIIAADVNGDGKADLISANYMGTLTVLTNDGNGGFVHASSPVVGSTYSVCAADINGDGKLDLIAPVLEGNCLTVLTNDGNGSFVLASRPGVGVLPDSVCAADVNGDGKMDLIVANYGTNGFDSTLTVLTNDGSGGFVLASSPGVGKEPQCVIAANVNGDGKMDLICANYTDNTLSVLTNDGSGGFVLASSPAGTYNAVCLVAADVNGDGKIDLITANYSGNSFFFSNSLSILTNDGSGGFTLAASIGVDGNPFSVCAADVNGDGEIDLIYPSYFYDQLNNRTYNGNLTVMTNDGNGNFALAVSLNPGSDAGLVCAADINGDGLVDIIGVTDQFDEVFTNATSFSPPTFIPPLTIAPLSTQIRVSWPSVSPGWSLQQNSSLATANWGPSGYNGFSISDDGTNKSLIMPTAFGNLFFRLLHP